MAIIYSYPSTDPQSSDLLVITRQPSDPDETANYSVSVNKLSNLIIANLVNGTDNYIPKFDGTNSLVNSLFYETDTGRVGLGTTTPSRKLQVAGDAIIDTDLEVDGGLDVAGTAQTGNLTVENSSTNPEITIGDIDNLSNPVLTQTPSLNIGNRVSSGNAGSCVINMVSGTYASNALNFRHGTDTTLTSNIARGSIETNWNSLDLDDYRFSIKHRGATSGTDNEIALQSDSTYFRKPLRIGADNAANELDDYEEGTFTPNIGSYIGGTITPVYNAQLGEYTKVGNIVTASFYLSLDSTTSFSGTGDLIFGGLPFTVKDQSSSPQQIVSQVSGTLSYFRGFDDAAMGKFVGVGRSITSTAVSLYKAVQIGSSPPDDKSIPITTADMVNTGSFYGDFVIAFTITYRTEQ